MALIACPECKKEISDSAVTCPHCGYGISKQTSDTSSTEKKVTQLVETKRNTGNGIIGIILGCFCIFGSLALFLIFFPLGIIGLVVSLGILIAGCHSINPKSKTGVCPYCNNKVEVPNDSITFKCIHCKKISNVRGMNLESI